ncbi:MAG: homocysteine S-methyltransferase family protein [Ilumatobacter sp.]|uniref:homocysteine S-methyltransferase family protein n=1 Tax=Ilumatobacter sp. TaxID=1967498 RepID=UPI003C71EFF0
MVEITILDGGMGKELRRIGAPFRQPEWSALALTEAPEMVVQAHANFIDAGAQVIITNNYAVVPFHLGEATFARHGAALVDLAGRLAREAVATADVAVDIAGSMPPLFGSYLPEAFDAPRAASIYADIAAALAPRVDLWLGETLSTIAEMRSIIAAIDAVGSKQPVWMSFALPNTFDDQGPALRSGETVADIAAAVAATGDRVDAVLFNCSLPEQTGPALAALRRALDAEGLRHVRTGGYANAFPVVERDDYSAREVIYERRDELTSDRYADIVASWVEDGATIVGGCCDMYPVHIAALVDRFAGREM